DRCHVLVLVKIDVGVLDAVLVEAVGGRAARYAVGTSIHGDDVAVGGHGFLLGGGAHEVLDDLGEVVLTRPGTFRFHDGDRAVAPPAADRLPMHGVALQGSQMRDGLGVVHVVGGQARG